MALFFKLHQAGQLTQKRTFRSGFLHTRSSSCLPTNSINTLNGTQSTNLDHPVASSYVNFYIGSRMPVHRSQHPQHSSGSKHVTQLPVHSLIA